MTESQVSFYGIARCLGLGLLLAGAAIAADQPLPNIPDPVGLGPRLALMDYLRTELHDDPPVDATYDQLVARYWLRVDGGASAAEAYRLRMALKDLGQPAPADADLATLRTLHATALAQAQAKERERELEAIRARTPAQGSRTVVLVHDSARTADPEALDASVPPVAAPPLAPPAAVPAPAPALLSPVGIAIILGAAAIGILLLARRRQGAAGSASSVVQGPAPQTTRRIRSSGLEGGIGERMRSAMEDLLRRLPAAEDGRMQDREFAALLAWRVENREGLSHPALRRFALWFNGIISEGVLDPAERKELVDYCQRFVANEIVAVPPGRDGGAWRHQPASPHQLAYLHSLGLSAGQCEGFSRGQACDLVERMYDERRESASAARRPALV